MRGPNPKAKKRDAHMTRRQSKGIVLGTLQELVFNKETYLLQMAFDCGLLLTKDQDIVHVAQIAAVPKCTGVPMIDGGKGRIGKVLGRQVPNGQTSSGPRGPMLKDSATKPKGIIVNVATCEIIQKGPVMKGFKTVVDIHFGKPFELLSVFLCGLNGGVAAFPFATGEGGRVCICLEDGLKLGTEGMVYDSVSKVCGLNVSGLGVFDFKVPKGTGLIAFALQFLLKSPNIRF